jgi:hypothetical protein
MSRGEILNGHKFYYIVSAISMQFAYKIRMFSMGFEKKWERERFMNDVRWLPESIQLCSFSYKR